MKNILITGGAGFIGTHLCKALSSKNKITVLDNLSKQVHGEKPNLEILNLENVNFVLGDVCDTELLKQHVVGKDYIIHLASETGTGQSMYEIKKYSDVNVGGTISLMNAIISSQSIPKKIILASSRAVYGEGKYFCEKHKEVYPVKRDFKIMQSGSFDPVCPLCGCEIKLLSTNEDSKLNPTSFYGLTKKIQEDIFSYLNKTVDIPTIILRFQNVYGPGQSLINPYTGVLSVFSTIMRKGDDVNVFEDGQESRDFVYIDDVIQSIILSLDSGLNYGIFNVGSGKSMTILEVANILKNRLNSNSKITISGNFRVGDIRHNVANIDNIKKEFGYLPSIKFEEGIDRLISWVGNQPLLDNNIEKSFSELKSSGILN
jgi:dTDP-L-rhamnose 4-epimerase